MQSFKRKVASRCLFQTDSQGKRDDTARQGVTFSCSNVRVCVLLRESRQSSNTITLL